MSLSLLTLVPDLFVACLATAVSGIMSVSPYAFSFLAFFPFLIPQLSVYQKRWWQHRVALNSSLFIKCGDSLGEVRWLTRGHRASEEQNWPCEAAAGMCHAPYWSHLVALGVQSLVRCLVALWGKALSKWSNLQCLIQGPFLIQYLKVMNFEGGFGISSRFCCVCGHFFWK